MCFRASLRTQFKNLEKRFGPIRIRSKDSASKGNGNPTREPGHEPGREVAVGKETEQERIFPGLFGSVLWNDGDLLVQERMVYGGHPPPHMAPAKAKGLTTYNARRDNLDSPFWEHMFLKRHGLVELDTFFEWVAVSDLLKVGRVSLEQVRAHFQAQAEERKRKRRPRKKPIPASAASSSSSIRSGRTRFSCRCSFPR